MRGKKKRITIADVARRAGVSPSTVSRVLTGYSGVAPDKQAAILAAVEEFDYRPNEAARMLANGSSKVIGVLTQTIASPFYGDMLLGIDEGLQGSDYSPMFTVGHWQSAGQLQALEVLLRRGVDSVIIVAGDIPAERLHTLAEEIPFVVIGRDIPGLEKHCIQIDNARGGYLATQHLINLGHRQIAHVAGISTHEDSIARQQGYTQALLEANLPVDPRLIVQGDFMEPSGLVALEMLLTHGVAFTAIFAANDQMAQGIQLGLYRRGIRVPDEMSVIGFDDQPGSSFSRPPLTTVRQPSFDMGFAAAQSVLAMLEGKEPPVVQLPVELIVRESTASIYPQRVRPPADNYRSSGKFGRTD